MKIAMLNISIGRYDVFWKDFYLTAEENFLPGHEKHYFVFTDNMNIYGNDRQNVSLLEQGNLGWPFNTMKRFHMFKRVEDKLKEYDYVFFINGNALFKQPLKDEFINPDKNIITIIHPGLYGRSMNEMPFERNPESNAYIPEGKGKFYVQGAFIGGKSSAFIEMINEVDRLTEEDLKNDIIAVWHDESFLNKYILDKKDIQVMGRQYLYYEEYVFPWKPVIMLRNKRAFGDLNKFRGNKEDRKKEFRQKVRLSIRNIVFKFMIMFRVKKILKNVTADGNYVDRDLNF